MNLTVRVPPAEMAKFAADAAGRGMSQSDLMALIFATRYAGGEEEMPMTA